ncbi:MAG TPA: sialate O-acetylesterase [Phycisphaerae bacterium]|nr:sialate O-acetylesterase [Phycisphaerae bacterium]
MALPIWGWADPAEEVTVTLDGHSVKTTADAAGRWLVKLPALAAGGPHDLVVEGHNRIKLEDVLIGEVWLCSGQSNMEMGVGVAMNAAAEVAAADYPGIRLLELPHRPAGEPADDIDVTWRVCSPQTIADGWWGGFSAVAYYFGREVHRELKVPVGLIDTSWGGTDIGPWTPPCGFAAVPTLRQVVSDVERKGSQYRSVDLPARLSEIEHWVADTRTALSQGKPLPPAPDWPRHPLASEREPTGLFNGMIQPLVPFAIRGALWYQGEANVYPDDGPLYVEKMKALIGGWRQVWGQGDFPFYFVQIAPFDYALHRPDLKPEQMLRICEAQRAALQIPHTGMVVTSDIGNCRDIHPENKQEVGRRLSLWALAKTYGREQLLCSGPLYRSMAIEKGGIRVHFDYVGGGLTTRDGQPPNWFEIAGREGKFVPADARIDGETVLVSSAQVTDPVAVRYAWSMCPEPLPNLTNREGLPASSFCTPGP